MKTEFERFKKFLDDTGREYFLTEFEDNSKEIQIGGWTGIRGDYWYFDKDGIQVGKKDSI